MAADVINLPVELGVEIVAAGVADQPRTRAVPAIRGAPVRHQEQHPVGVSVHQPGHGRMRILAAGVAHLPGRDMGLLDPRDDLPADRAVLVRRVNQVEEIGRDGQRQLVVGQGRAGELPPASASASAAGSCSTVVMRCLSCQCQSFQSASGTLLQKPLPAERNSLRFPAELRDGGSSPLSDPVLFCILPPKMG